jgi:hypothetical protein
VNLEQAKRTFDVLKTAMIDSRHKMERKLFILAFVLSVTSNSMAAACLYSAENGECEGTCCRVARCAEMSANAQKLRCLTQCNHPLENQAVPEAPVLRAERDKTVAFDAPRLSETLSTSCEKWRRSPDAAAFASMHNYLRTGALLI